MAITFTPFHSARHLDKIAEQQQLLGYGGLPRVGVRDNRKRASLVDFTGKTATAHSAFILDCTDWLQALKGRKVRHSINKQARNKRSSYPQTVKARDMLYTIVIFKRQSTEPTNC
jgi:hypothetical protein